MEKYFEINEDGINIKCKLYYKENDKIYDIIISCHGFGGSKENNTARKLAKSILKKRDNIAVLTFDWPCHGKDVRQKLHLIDCNNYLNKVIDYAYKKFGARDLYLNATSFGGYLSLKYIKENENPFKKIVLRCPAVNMYHLLNEKVLTEKDKEELSKNNSILFGFERKIKITPEFLEDLKTYDITRWNYYEYSNNILIIQGNNDELVNPNDVKEFCGVNEIDCISLEDTDHMFKNPIKMNEFISYATKFMFEEIL